MNKDLFWVKVTPETSALVQQILFANNYLWIDGDDQVSDTDAQYLIVSENKRFLYSREVRSCIDNCLLSQKPISLEQFGNWIRTGILYQNTLELNSEYTAIINKDSVKVGCQVFSREVALKFAELIQKIMK